MNTIRDLYDLILEEYGKRGCWISELADKLGISIKNANCLTYKMGYRRGRALLLSLILRVMWMYRQFLIAYINDNMLT